MIADYFWKVIFIVLLVIGLKFWFEWRDGVNSYNKHLSALAEILESPTKKGDKACKRVAFQSMYHLHEIEKVKGEKFEIRTVMNEIEKEKYWKLLTDFYPTFNLYRSKTERDIPLVKLVTN